MGRKVVLLIIISKIVIVTVIILGFFNLKFADKDYWSALHYPQNEPITLQTAFKTWDAQHYLYLSQVWYKPNQESNRFFPLLPFLIRIFIPIFHNPLLIGLAVSNIFSVVGIIFFYLFVKDYFKDSGVALWSVVLLLVFPTSFFISLVYSESAFFCFTMLFLYYLYKNNLKLASLAAFFIPFSRPVGILIVIPFAYFLLTYHRNKSQNLSLKDGLRHLSEIKSFVPIIGPILGFGIYSIMMHLYTGSFFSGYASQESYGSGWHAAIDPVLFIKNLLAPVYSTHTYTNSIIDRSFFIFYIVILYFIYKKLDKTLFVYSLTFGLIPLLGSFTSYTRYVLVVFPIFMVLALFFQTKQYRFSKFLLIGLLILGQIIFLIEHALNYWVA